MSIDFSSAEIGVGRRRPRWIQGLFRLLASEAFIFLAKSFNLKLELFDLPLGEFELSLGDLEVVLGEQARVSTRSSSRETRRLAFSNWVRIDSPSALCSADVRSFRPSPGSKTRRAYPSARFRPRTWLGRPGDSTLPRSGRIPAARPSEALERCFGRKPPHGSIRKISGTFKTSRYNSNFFWSCLRLDFEVRSMTRSGLFLSSREPVMVAIASLNTTHDEDVRREAFLRVSLLVVHHQIRRHVDHRVVGEMVGRISSRSNRFSRRMSVSAIGFRSLDAVRQGALQRRCWSILMRVLLLPAERLAIDRHPNQSIGRQVCADCITIRES